MTLAGHDPDGGNSTRLQLVKKGQKELPSDGLGAKGRRLFTVKYVLLSWRGSVFGLQSLEAPFQQVVTVALASAKQ